MASLSVGRSDLFVGEREYVISSNPSIPSKKLKSDARVETSCNFLGQISRIDSALRPILKEFDPFSYPIYLIEDSYHLYSSFKDLINSKDIGGLSKELITTALAVAYLAWNLLGSELWSKVSTVEDIIYNLSEMVHAFSKKEYYKVCERIFDIVNDLLWLLSYYYLYVEVEALSYAIDMISYLYYGLKELKGKDWALEFAGKMAMTAIRAHNVFSYFPEIRMKYEKKTNDNRSSLIPNLLKI